MDESAATWVLQEPRDLRGWRAHMCEACNERRDLLPVQNRVVLELRKLMRQSSLAVQVERV